MCNMLSTSFNIQQELNGCQLFDYFCCYCYYYYYKAIPPGTKLQIPPSRKSSSKRMLLALSQLLTVPMALLSTRLFFYWPQLQGVLLSLLLTTHLHISCVPLGTCKICCFLHNDSWVQKDHQGSLLKMKMLRLCFSQSGVGPRNMLF